MTATPLLKAGLLTALLVICFFTAWELHLRNDHIPVSYDDGEALWADKRNMVYEAPENATVFIGSSRNKYDIDIPTWHSLTGEKAIQLAIEGNSPLPVLDDLASDTKFHGKLIIDVTEILFFTTSPHNITEPANRIAYFKKRTPAQRFSFIVNHELESHFVFLDKEYFSLNALLDRLPVPRRKGVFALPYNCPFDFNPVSFDRQNIMTERFLKDTTLQNRVKGLWDVYRKIGDAKPADRHKTDSIFAVVKNDIDKIRSRGGKVIFVRTPSSDPFLMGEKMAYPREKYWDKMLTVTATPGIYFEDYPAIAHFQCPEFSHLKPSDAIVFTKNIVHILETDKGWKFHYTDRLKSIQ